jgi:hypothetical protein
MQMIDFWIVRKDEDAWKVGPEVGGAISEHPDNGKCLFCGDGHEIVAVIAFCWREPDAHIYTAGICLDCAAAHSDDKLAEMTQQEVFPDRVAHLLAITEVYDQMEAMGLIETVGIDPITGSKRRRLTAKGLEKAQFERQAKEVTQH